MLKKISTKYNSLIVTYRILLKMVQYVWESFWQPLKYPEFKVILKCSTWYCTIKTILHTHAKATCTEMRSCVPKLLNWREQSQTSMTRHESVENNIDDGEEFACEELKTEHTCLTESCARKTQWLKEKERKDFRPLMINRKALKQD